MILPLYQVDAFTTRTFGGNPAAVVPLTEWLADEWLQHIARENNLSETAFFIPEGPGYQIRWFTPTTEVDLCGHATLATAHVLYNHLNTKDEQLIFSSRSGPLKVTRDTKRIILNFPVDDLEPVMPPEGLIEAIGRESLFCYKGKDDYLLVYEKQADIRDLVPDFSLLMDVEARGIIVSAPGEWTDFVSRFFCPRVGINEDPVTGSAHTSLIPYWSRQLAKTELTARQLSDRGGELYCRHRGNRVEIGGEAITYLIGEIHLPENITE